MGLSGSFARPVLRTVTMPGSCRAVTLPCLIRVSSVARKAFLLTIGHGATRNHFRPALAAAAGSMCLRAAAAWLRTSWSLSDKPSISIGTAALALV